MKGLILAALGVSALAGTLFYLYRPQVMPVSPSEPVAERVSVRTSEAPPRAEPILTVHEPSKSPSLHPAQPARTVHGAEPATASIKAGLNAAELNQAIDTLVSAQVPYSQKQATWKQLRDAGKLDQAISELERRMAADPRAAEYPAALGQAYLKKCATLQDIREQGILAMQADKAFDTALDLDPSNWDARFTKAVGLSYWPAGMNKGDEVIQHFQTLIQQQESQPSQPQFAETYVRLGDQYQKSGRNDYARAVWERGSSLFPDHDVLKSKIAALNTAQGSSTDGGQ